MKRIELQAGKLLGHEKVFEVPLKEGMAAAIDVDPDPEQVYEELLKLGLGDGLPVIPPTEKRVRRMLEYCDRPPDHVLAKLPPQGGEATCAIVAINAVMAGCEPYYFPILMAIVEACGDAYDGLKGALSTTYGSWPMIVVNGPLRNEVGVNCSWGCMGSGFRVNNTLGRALTLLLTNVGGSRPGINEKKPLGNPNRFGICFGENEEMSPWEPLHVERGLPKDVSTVTVFPATELLRHATSKGSGDAAAEVHVLSLALSDASECQVMDGPTGAPMLIVLNPVTARILHEGGWTKHKLQQHLFEHGGISREQYEREVAMVPFHNVTRSMWPEWARESKRLPCVADPKDIWIVVAGSDAAIAVDGIIPSHPAVGGYPVIRPIALANGRPAHRIRQFRKVLQ